jgi:hypothetical protein
MKSGNLCRTELPSKSVRERSELLLRMKSERIGGPGRDRTDDLGRTDARRLPVTFVKRPGFVKATHGAG